MRPKPHKEILTKEQVNLLPLVKSFSKDFGLVGGTAIALYLGHRRSIDFDLFALKKFGNLSIQRKILKFQKIEKIFVNKLGEYTISINGVRITFFHYPYKIEFNNKLDDIIRMPDPLTLSAMKAYALGMRAKWKDYIDLYFVMKRYHGIDKIIKKAKKIFSSEFNEKLFRSQLSYFKDIDFTENIIYLEGFKIDDKIIKKGLIDFSLKKS